MGLRRLDTGVGGTWDQLRRGLGFLSSSGHRLEPPELLLGSHSFVLHLVKLKGLERPSEPTLAPFPLKGA